MAKPTRSVQTTRVNGKRVRLVTTTTATGTKVTMREAPVEEWLLQAAAVRALKAMPEYAASVEAIVNGKGCFTIAGDMNGDYRSKRAAVIAKATGIAAGDPDLRLYFAGGVLRLIEYKNGEGALTASQRVRHPLLAALGFPVEVLKAKTEDEAAERTVELVRGWLSANANKKTGKSADAA